MIMTHGICKVCNAKFMETDFLTYRKSGYCTLECSIGEPPGKSSAEGMAWKDKISLLSLREKLTNQSNINLPIRNWQFDMVHYPAPKGWQIENWRLEE